MENACVLNDCNMKTTEFDDNNNFLNEEFDCEAIDSLWHINLLLPDTEILQDIVDPESMQDIECLENMQMVCPEDILPLKSIKALPNQISDGVANINDEKTMDDVNNDNQPQINTQEMEDSVLSMEDDYEASNETIFDNVSVDRSSHLCYCVLYASKRKF